MVRFYYGYSEQWRIYYITCMNGKGAGRHALWFSKFFFSTKTLITQNWLFLVNFLRFFSSLVFFRVYTIRLMRLPKVFFKSFDKDQ